MPDSMSAVNSCKMADEENIRRCVRDELELNLVQRTRNLIRSGAVLTAKPLGSESRWKFAVERVEIL